MMCVMVVNSLSLALKFSQVRALAWCCSFSSLLLDYRIIDTVCCELFMSECKHVGSL